MNIFRLSVGLPASRGAAAVGSPTPVAIAPKVAAGRYHTLLLGSDGKVYSCGYNGSGQLGQATVHSVVGTPTRIREWLNPDIAITGIAAGGHHTLLLATTGEVYSCGYNTWGQLGQAIMQQIVETPTRMKWLLCPQIAIIDIAACGYHTLLLGSDGKVYSCGYNGYGQLGHGTQASQHQPMRIEGLPRIKGIAVGDYHTLLLTEQGEVYSCGNNDCGQLGHGAEQPRPMRIEGLPPIKGIAAGGKHTLLLTEQGEVYSCGSNIYGQLGYIKWPWQYRPRLMKKLPRIKGIAAAGYHTILLAEQGEVYSCGNNSCGQLGQKPMIRYNPGEKEIVTPRPMQTLDPIEVASVAPENDYCNIM